MTCDLISSRTQDSNQELNALHLAEATIYLDYPAALVLTLRERIQHEWLLPLPICQFHPRGGSHGWTPRGF